MKTPGLYTWSWGLPNSRDHQDLLVSHKPGRITYYAQPSVSAAAQSNMKLLILALLAVFYDFSAAQFQVLDANAVANTTSVTISDACLNALQGTVNCNSSLVNIAAADSFYGIDNDTYATLCSEGCSSSLESYHNAVSSACSDQPEAWSGYPATYFGDVYWATYNLSCLADPHTGSSCMGTYLLTTWVCASISLLTLCGDRLLQQYFEQLYG